MTTTPGLGLELVVGGAAGGVTVNEIFTVLDSVLGRGVEDIQNDAPSSPEFADAYIVGTPTSGDAWEGHDAEIAVWINERWHFYPVERGVRTYVRSTNTAITKTGSGWSHATNDAVFFARLSSAFTYAGGGSPDVVDNWTQMHEVGTDRVYDLQGSTGEVVVQDAGVYHIIFSGTATPLSSASTFEVGIGHESSTLEDPNLVYASAPVNFPVAFCAQLVYPAEAGDSFFAAVDRTSGSGGWRFEVGCSLYMKLVAIS